MSEHGAVTCQHGNLSSCPECSVLRVRGLRQALAARDELIGELVDLIQSLREDPEVLANCPHEDAKECPFSDLHTLDARTDALLARAEEMRNV